MRRPEPAVVRRAYVAALIDEIQELDVADTLAVRRFLGRVLLRLARETGVLEAELWSLHERVRRLEMRERRDG